MARARSSKAWLKRVGLHRGARIVEIMKKHGLTSVYMEKKHRLPKGLVNEAPAPTSLIAILLDIGYLALLSLT